MPYLGDLAIVKHICGGKPDIYLETDSGYLKWLGMWLHGAASNLRWGQTAWGLNCGSWYVSKNRQPRPRSLPLPPPTNLPLFLIADADYCQSKAIIESEEKTHLLLINPHQIIRWLTATECDSHVGRKRRVKRFVNDKEKTKLKVLREAESCSQDRVSGTRHHRLLSPFISLFINSSVAA